MVMVYTSILNYSGHRAVKNFNSYGIVFNNNKVITN